MLPAATAEAEAAAATGGGGGGSGNGGSSSEECDQGGGWAALAAATPAAADLEAWLGDALFCARLCAYAQGLAQLAAAARDKGWAAAPADAGSVGGGGVSVPARAVRCWRGGCIIRAALLGALAAAYARDPDLPNPLLDPAVTALLAPRVGGWRRAVALCALRGVQCPALSAALAFYDAYRSPRLASAALVQAQRDCFGGHTYRRTDEPGAFHSAWGGEKREGGAAP